MKSFKSLRRRLQAIYPKTLRSSSLLKQQEVKEDVEQTEEVQTLLNTSSGQHGIAHPMSECDRTLGTTNDDDMVPQPIADITGDPDTTDGSWTGQEDATSIAVHETGEGLEGPRLGMSIVFDGEDATDYTDGPVRLIGTTDGSKYCTALLMSLELSAKVQDALRAQRNFVKAELSANQELEALNRFDSKLRRQAMDTEMRLVMIEEDEGPKGSEHDDLKEELRILRLMREANKGKRRVVSTNLDTQSTMLREFQSLVIADLEEPFVCARLLEAEWDISSELVDEFDLQQEFQAFRASLDEYADLEEEDAAPLQTYTNNMKLFGPLTEEETREKGVKKAWWAAFERLQAAERAFSNRDVERQAEWNANFEAEERGEQAVDASQEDYDMRMLKREQEMTRELIDAEEEFAAAKAAAKDAGLELGEDDQTSDFVDDVADGYRASFEEERIASVPEPVVHNWLDTISDPASPSYNDRLDDGDEWQADDVEISDSISLVAEGSERRRIDKWRKVCGL